MPFGELSRQMVEEGLPSGGSRVRRGCPAFGDGSLMSASPFAQQSRAARFAARWTGLPDGQIFAYKLAMGNGQCKALH